MVSLTLFGRMRSARGQAMIEVALTIPILLLIAVGIFEFGRAYQTWQVLTNAAREGARVAVLPNRQVSSVQSVARSYMQNGALPNYGSATISLNATTIAVNGNNVPASQVTVQYPFNFIVLGPVARLVSPQSTLGDGNLTMTVNATMRNE